MSQKIYEMITGKIISYLSQGYIPWNRPWINGDAPINLLSGKEYRGINPFILSCSDFDNPYWLTFKQAKKMGGTIKKGEKGTPVIFWNWIDKKDKNSDDETVINRIPLLKYYTVFNVEQCTDISSPERPKNIFNPIYEAEKIIHGMPKRPTITHDESKAFYRPSTDTVNIPKSNLFITDEEYYNTLFHELIHSTGHKSRLDRHAQDKVNHMFGSKDYSKEELTAEFGAAFLCGKCNIEKPVIKNSAAYIQGWLKKLNSDAKFIIQAAAKAQKAADYILDIKYGEPKK